MLVAMQAHMHVVVESRRLRLPPAERDGATYVQPALVQSVPPGSETRAASQTDCSTAPAAVHDAGSCSRRLLPGTIFVTRIRSGLIRSTLAMFRTNRFCFTMFPLSCNAMLSGLARRKARQIKTASLFYRIVR